MLKRFGVLAGLILTANIYAQFDPEGAQVISYFPHLADGGSQSQQWVTTLTFVNPHASSSASAIAHFYGDNGSLLPLDFGNGPASTLNFTVPPGGTVSFKTKGDSPTTVTGWALVTSTLPLEGVIQFRFAVNGVPQQGISSQATPASTLFRSPATTTTGIAVANIYSTQSITVNVVAVDSNGNDVAAAPVSLGPLAHQSFTVGQMFPTLPSTFRGSVEVGTGAASTYTVVWTVSGDGGFLASNPPAGLNWPISQSERISKVWAKVLNAAVNVFPLGTPPTLVIDHTSGQINSFADPTKNQVHIFENLAELISDSESELSFVVGHEIGHIIQARVGGLIFVPGNSEQDADEYGMLLSLTAGYDPYGAAGALAKLAMASGNAALLSQTFDNLTLQAGTDLHGSFNDRLALLFQNMQEICGDPDFQSFCATYKGVIHPLLPPSAPLLNHVP